MNQLRQLKSGNSKSQLVRAILTYQRALAYYASDKHWTKSYEGKFTWNDERHPTEVAKIVLGIAKEVPLDLQTLSKMKQFVREPDDTSQPVKESLSVKS